MSKPKRHFPSASLQTTKKAPFLVAGAIVMVLQMTILAHPARADRTDPDFVPPEITLPYPASAQQAAAQPAQAAPAQAAAGQASGQTQQGYPGFQVPGMPGNGGGMNPFLMKAADRLRQPPGSQFASKGMAPPGAAAGQPPAGASAYGGPPPVTPGNPMPQNGQPVSLSTQAKIADPTAVIATSKGNITIMLFRQYAPNTVAAFMQMVKEGFYNGLKFHRVEPGFVIQGGCPYGNGTGNYPPNTNQPRFLPLETSPNVRHNAAGVVAMAHQPGNDNTASCQFYITLRATPSLDGHYTVFGGVTSGMDVVNRITKDDPIISITVSQ